VSGEKLSLGVGGRVVEVGAQEGDRVRKGDLLLRLETERLDQDLERRSRKRAAALEEASRLEDLRRKVRAQFEGESARAAAELRLAELELGRAREEEERTRALVEQDLLPRLDLTNARARLREAEARRERASVDGTAREFEVRIGEIDLRLAAKRAEAESEARELEVLEREREKSVLRAHVDGIVTVGEVKVGDYLEGGRPVFAIAQELGFRADAAVSSADIGRLRVGMTARIKLDAFDYQKYGTLEGTITYISPDSEVAEERRLYYVVRIRLDAPRLPVKLGMLGQAEIVTGEERVLSYAFRKFKDKVSPR
jgi:multidrug resistance efflux pump